MNPLTIDLIKQFVLGSSAMLAILFAMNLLISKKYSSNDKESLDHA